MSLLENIRMLGGEMEIPRDLWPEANHLRREGKISLSRAHVSIQHPGQGRNFKTAKILEHPGSAAAPPPGEKKAERGSVTSAGVRIPPVLPGEILDRPAESAGATSKEDLENPRSGRSQAAGSAGDVSPSAVLLDAWKAQTFHDEKADDEGKRSPAIERTYTWGSGWRECRRAMCLDLLHPEDTVFEGETLEKFRQGNRFEDDTILHLKAGGRRVRPRFSLTSEQQRVRIKDRQGRAVIVGKTDDTLVFDHDRRRRPLVLEVKGGESVRNCRSVDDLLRGKWTKGYPRQVLSYLLALSIESGVLVLKRPGWPTILDVHLEGVYDGVSGLELAEDFQQRAERAVACRLDGAELPGYHSDPSVCLRCAHRGKSCAPPLDAGQGLKLIMDYGLTEHAKTVVETSEAHRDYKRSWKALGDAVGSKGLRLPLVSLRGRYLVKGKASALTTTGPDGKKTTDPAGRWLMEVEKLPAADDDEQDLTPALKASLAAAKE